MMRAKLQNGFIVNGRLAKIFVSRGIATEIETKAEVKTSETKEPVKRTRRTKAQIETDKKKKDETSI